ncbi:hepatitis A virus cellular receptor 1-like [Pecten maximus]|uniref:hepatitis A virus cellular receptor 1-like n=1 Tax=Pecten maximus TaxID=6579 RepID=UPI00145804A0|nr:hepatitis A virus cellular receptor 1-like [Pecten maximus]
MPTTTTPHITKTTVQTTTTTPQTTTTPLQTTTILSTMTIPTTTPITTMTVPMTTTETTANAQTTTTTTSSTKTTTLAAGAATTTTTPQFSAFQVPVENCIMFTMRSVNETFQLPLATSVVTSSSECALHCHRNSNCRSVSIKGTSPSITCVLGTNTGVTDSDIGAVIFDLS